MVTMNETEIYTHIDSQAEWFIQKLKEAVAIPSVSGDLKFRSQVVGMADWLEKEMKTLGVE